MPTLAILAFHSAPDDANPWIMVRLGVMLILVGFWMRRRRAATLRLAVVPSQKKS